MTDAMSMLDFIIFCGGGGCIGLLFLGIGICRGELSGHK
jgi:hypothetical protein